MPRRTLIFMVKPPTEVVAAIDALRDHRGVSRRYPADRLHITAFYLGDASAFGEAAMADLHSAAASVPPRPFRVVFDRLESNMLLGSDPMSGAIRFQRTLAQALATRGIGTHYRFSPHLSLAYGAPISASREIDAISWQVTEFLLVESVDGEGHHILGRWALSA